MASSVSLLPGIDSDTVPPLASASPATLSTPVEQSPKGRARRRRLRKLASESSRGSGPHPACRSIIGLVFSRGPDASCPRNRRRQLQWARRWWAARPLGERRLLYSENVILDAIEAKKRGGELSAEVIREVVGGYTSGGVPDYQMSALLMAIFIRGMDYEETLALTEAMADSGARHSFPECVDKHSTGG